MSTDVSYDPRLGSTKGEARHTPAAKVAAALTHADTVAVDLPDDETGLGSERLKGELAKAAAQARHYADVAVDGSWLRASVDHLPDGTELKRVQMSLGPLAIFGASNFPFAFGVLGHDTRSALTAGAPVLVKAHPAHPRLSAHLGVLGQQALAEAGAPPGTFAVVAGMDSGLALIDAPAVRAVAFTGSQTGGMAPVERALNRPQPIPVFAEVGTVKPAILTPTADRERMADVVSTSHRPARC